MEQLEKVYLGATLLRARFPDVSQISKKVLDAFFHMRGDLPLEPFGSSSRLSLTSSTGKCITPTCHHSIGAKT